MKITFNFAVVLVLLFMFSKNASAQDICVIPEQKISAVKGVVSYVDEENRVRGASVKLKRVYSDKIIAEIETAEGGSFQIVGSYEGKYILVVSRPNAVSLHIPIRVVKKRNGNYLQITLGAVIGESCGGGEVKLIAKK